MVTDTLRALLLERCGYTTIVFEFVGGEHTAKNVMIAAVKRPQIQAQGEGGSGSGLGVKGAVGGGKGSSAVEGEEIGGEGEGEGVESKEDNLSRARVLLAKIVAGEKAVKAEKKKKFQSVTVNAFGDVDDESYTAREGESEGERDREREGESEEETQRKLLEIADMIENNDRVARMEEEEKESAIERRIATVMKTFGIKELKLLDLVLGSKEMKHGSEPILVKSGITEIEKPTALAAEEEKKIKKQLKMRKFRR